MSNNRMLIDATHPEETRVVVLRGGRVEEFDYESAARKLLRGNIYLAKVTRVEPSLQAAFVDYGGNRHGFLAFNEIHPDYYQIPVADRQALIDEEAAAEAAEEAAVDARAEAMARRRSKRDDRARHAPEPEPAHSHRHVVDVVDEDNEPEEVEPAGVVPHAEPDHDDGEAVAARDRDVLDLEPEAAGAARGSASEPAETAEPEAEAIAAAPASSVASEDEGARSIGEQSGYGDAVTRSEPVEEGSAGPDEASGAQTSGPISDIPRVHGLVEDEGVHEVNGTTEPEAIEQVGAEDAFEEMQARPRRRPRSYKIQEVIKRRQIILVQVVKEERGNKGAALTTYLSLAGRYTVLMPNTARGGGISRKITNPQDRKRLKAIAQELEVPEGMGLIIRTAGAARTKQEIKRDFEYLLRLWESVRELTLQSVAPSLVYEEGNLIKRSIRDLYNKDVDEIVVAGADAHAEARDFMRMLMPSHAKNVIEYREPEPLFTRYQIERQLNAMFSPYVTLRSGGYLVINQTEALVAIDVNSGKSTREFSIEETAHNTNLEAADEIARQLKLRDLAGLIVIDFIDMEEKRNNRSVERRLKDALRFDRARIQVGRISHFGLMEMSRQRLRTGVLEGSTSQCPHCQGTGIIRSTESVALAVLRGLEDALMAGGRTSLIATTTPSVALYVLNNKRPFIIDMEKRCGLPIIVQGSDKMQGANFTIEKGAAPAQIARRPERNVVNMDWGFEGEAEEVVEGEEVDEAPIERDVARDGERDGDRDRDHDNGGREANGDGQNGDGRRRRRRRRRGRRGGFRGEGGGEALQAGGEASYQNDSLEEGEEGPHGEDMVEDVGGHDADEDPGYGAEAGDTGGAAEAGPEGEADDAAHDETAQGEPRRRSRRRGRRGGRRGRDGERTRTAGAGDGEVGETDDGSAATDDEDGEGVVAAEPAVGPADAEAPVVEKRRPAAVTTPVATVVETIGEAEAGEHKSRATKSHPTPEPVAEHATSAAASETEAAAKPAESTLVEAKSEAAVSGGRRTRSAPTASEPKIERVIVGTSASEGEPAAEAEKASRKGWWSRRFGGV